MVEMGIKEARRRSIKEECARMKGWIRPGQGATCMCIFMYIRVLHTHACIYTYIYILSLYIYTYRHIDMSFHLQIHAYVFHVYVYTHTNNICTHIQVLLDICNVSYFLDPCRYAHSWFVNYECVAFPGRRDRYERNVKLYWYEKAPEGMMQPLAGSGISGSLYFFGCPKKHRYIYKYIMCIHKRCVYIYTNF